MNEQLQIRTKSCPHTRKLGPGESWKICHFWSIIYFPQIAQKTWKLTFDISLQKLLLIIPSSESTDGRRWGESIFIIFELPCSAPTAEEELANTLKGRLKACFECDDLSASEDCCLYIFSLSIIIGMSLSFRALCSGSVAISCKSMATPKRPVA